MQLNKRGFETRVYGARDVAGNGRGRCCSPRHSMPFISTNEGSVRNALDDVVANVCQTIVGGQARHRGAGEAADPGEAVLVDPVKPMLKAPGTKRLKLHYDAPLSSFAFKINLRRYILEEEGKDALDPDAVPDKIGRVARITHLIRHLAHWTRRRCV